MFIIKRIGGNQALQSKNMLIKFTCHVNKNNQSRIK